MSRGLSRSQIGVTEAMVESFGETIFRLSHNLQRRRGDPIRLKDFAAIERQRADLGLSDAEISRRIGLSRDQVTFIRNLVERRKIRRNHYQRLLELGGGRRFRAERFTPHEQRQGYSEAAMNLRDAMRFDGERAALYLERGWWSPADTLSQWLARAASETPHAPAILGNGQSLSYGELAGRVSALAGGLKALGLGSGDVVAVQLPNRAEYLVSYLAICAIGGVMTTLYVPYRAAEMESLLAHSRARAFIGLDDMGGFSPAGTVLDLRSRIASLEHVVVLGDAPRGARSFDDLTEAAPHDLSDGPVAADPFLLLYTSGTSARPKGVPLACQGILGNARLGVPEHGITAADRILSAAPFGHLYALYSVHLALSAGAAAVLLPAFTPPDLARTLVGEAVTVLFAAPAHIAACLGAGLLSADTLFRLRLAVLSGSAGRSGRGEGIAGAHGERTRHSALGDDRDPGRPLHPAGRSRRNRRRLGRPAQSGHRGAGGRCGRGGVAGRRGGRASDTRSIALPRVLRPSGGHPRRIHRRRMVPHRRSRHRHDAGERRDHGAMQGRHQSRRHQVQPP